MSWVHFAINALALSLSVYSIVQSKRAIRRTERELAAMARERITPPAVQAILSAAKTERPQSRPPPTSTPGPGRKRGPY